uniref:Serine/threonine-protein kinase dkf-1 n=2 Tax=Culex pipiens TaxID=7175 RepID=A0A8D8FW57_CULPI
MSSSGGLLKDLGHPGFNETLKSHNTVTFKLVKTVSDFTETLAQLYEQHAEALQLLVSNYRKRNGELRKERPACQSNLFFAWETFMQEIEADSQATIDVASALSRQIARPLLERSFYRKVQSRKVFTHRESFDTIISKTEDKLSKCRIDYKDAYIAHRQNPTQQTLTQYIDSHNAYVQQLHATNAMLNEYHCETLPQLMQELEEIYSDLCNIVSEAVLQTAESISVKALEQSKRYDNLANQCKNVSPSQDLGYFVRSLPVPANSQQIPKKPFAPPQPEEGEDFVDYGINILDSSASLLKNELIVDSGASIQVRPSLEALKRESQELEIQIKQLQDSVDALVRSQIKGVENQLYNKANEIQEDISMKKFDLRAKQVHLAAVRAQKELFLGRIDPGSPRGERKMSSSSSSSMKTKWLKAFRSLKPTGSANDRKSGNGAQLRFDGSDNHNLLEYTYKKITPCDVCSQVLRGHTRQGLRCRICKVNVHADCATQLPKCQVKQKLLRRQKSTSEIESRTELEEEKPTDIDQIYQVLKKAGEISSGKVSAVESRVQVNSTSTSDANAVMTGASNSQLEIPVVNVPAYPDRTPKKGPVKPQWPNFQPQKGLSAPSTMDMSNSAEEADTTLSTRPFGQPLCFVAEEPPPEEPTSTTKKGARRTK